MRDEPALLPRHLPEADLPEKIDVIDGPKLEHEY